MKTGNILFRNLGRFNKKQITWTTKEFIQTQLNSEYDIETSRINARSLIDQRLTLIKNYG